MDLWAWIYRFLADARRNGDQERARLYSFFRSASPHFDLEPDRALASLDQGRQLAERLGEPWWVLFYDHWRLQILLFHKRDYVTALDLAVRSAVEVRKSAYELLPQRICLHEDLINAYVGTDPVGNADAIEHAMEYMQGQITPGLSCEFCLQGLRINFNLVMNRIAEAKKETDRYLAMDDIDDHYYSEALLNACEVGTLQKDWQSVLAWAKEAEPICRRLGRHTELTESLAWQALAMRQTGQELEGSRTYLMAANYGSRLGAIPGEGYYDALCAYQEVGENWEFALEIRGRELANLLGKGQIWRECQCRLNRCRLLKRLGKPLDDELSAAREIAGKLKDPTPILAELDQIERGQ